MSEHEFRSLRGTAQVLLLWFAAYVAASMASTIAVLLTGHGQSDIRDIPVWVLGANVAAMWTVYVIVVPRLLPFEDAPIQRVWKSWFSRRDIVIGIPAGVGGQLVLVNIVNWPLSRFFPDVFSFEDVSRRAEDIVATAPGAWILLLVVIVVVGAPIVEEIVYRGSMQTGLVKHAGTAVGVVLTAAIFAAVHLSPVEFPGLFVFALLLGVLRQRSGTLGAPIIAHMAFNATGLVLVSLF